MKLYLVQHANAKSKEEDPLRPLSNEGWEEIKRIAEYARRYLHIEVDQILHSGKLRAKQTAETLARQLELPKLVNSVEGLEPRANPHVMRDYLAETQKDILVVGHLPHLSKLANLLLVENEEKDVIVFRNACLVCLERQIDSRWRLVWMITPETVPQDLFADAAILEKRPKPDKILECG